MTTIRERLHAEIDYTEVLRDRVRVMVLNVWDTELQEALRIADEKGPADPIAAIKLALTLISERIALRLAPMTTEAVQRGAAFGALRHDTTEVEPTTEPNAS